MSEDQSDPLIYGVTLGTRVEVELLDATGGAETLIFDIVPDSQSDFASGFLGVGTLLGCTLLGHRAGDVVPYRIADIVQARLVSVVPSTRPAGRDQTASRKVAIRQAVTKSDLEEMARLALTVDVKWGEWEPPPPEA